MGADNSVGAGAWTGVWGIFGSGDDGEASFKESEKGDTKALGFLVLPSEVSFWVSGDLVTDE